TRQNPRAGHFQTLEADSVPKALKIIQKLDGCLDVAREPHTAEKREELGVILRVEVVMTDYGALLRDHVTLRCRSIDRIFLQAYVPKLQSVGEVCIFLRWQRKFPIPSSAASAMNTSRLSIGSLTLTRFLSCTSKKVRT